MSTHLNNQFQMKTCMQLLLCLCLLGIHSTTYAQFEKPILDNVKIKGEVMGQPSETQQIETVGFINPKSDELGKDWNVSFRKLHKGINHEVPNREVYEAIKQQKTKQKQQTKDHFPISDPNNALDDAPAATKAATITTYKATGFRANRQNGLFPPDNSVAISDAGYLVSVVNTSVAYYTTSGTQLYSKSFYDFFSFLSSRPTSKLFDPKVLYDTRKNRFIMLVLHGSTPSTSELMLCFSKTQDPRDGWWVYRLDGDPKNNNRWFDYPNMGVSKDLYISGNQFSSSDSFQGSLLYQIKYDDAFTGGTINKVYWYDINRPSGADCNAFTLVPMTYGQEGSYGPGIYLVSSCSGGADEVYLWDVTKNYGDSPLLKSYIIPTASYSIPGNALQKGISDVLDTGGCRVRSGFYMNGYIHFVFSTEHGSGYSRIRYNRIKLSDKSISYKNYGASGYDYCYPAVASASSSANDKSVIIGFVRSGKNIYPQARACAFGNSINDSSSSRSSKGGETYVNNSSDSDERWGDYTGITRDYTNGLRRTYVWTAGHYGVRENSTENHVYNTYLSRFYMTASSSLEQDENDRDIQTAPTASQQTFANTAEVAPNPIYDYFRIKIDMPARTEISIQVVDALGQYVQTLYTGKASKGISILSFNKGALTSGTYVLLIRDHNNNTVQHEKIVIAH